MFEVSTITQLQHDLVAKWHQQDVEVEGDGLLEIVCRQHSFNFLLWHQEDIARSPNVGDEKIAQVKRNIDGYNQNRNDWIEKIDDWIQNQLENSSTVSVATVSVDGAPINTETPGSAVDRLSIMSLRLYHMAEQLDRTDVEQTHIDSVKHKIAVCRLQHADLSNSLQELIGDIVAGKKQHRIYRQFKMYNDPTLNPYLYDADKK